MPPVALRAQPPSQERKPGGLLDEPFSYFYQSFPGFVAKLTGLGDDLQAVALPGQDHDNTLPFGWPWAKAFLEDRLPAR